MTCSSSHVNIKQSAREGALFYVRETIQFLSLPSEVAPTSF